MSKRKGPKAKNTVPPTVLLFTVAQIETVGAAAKERFGKCAAWYFPGGAGQSTLFDRIPEPEVEGAEIDEVMDALTTGNLEHGEDIESVVGSADDIELGFHSGATLEQVRESFEADGFQVVADSKSARPGARWPWDLIQDPTAPFDVRFQRVYDRLALAYASAGYFAADEGAAVGLTSELLVEALAKGSLVRVDDAILRMPGMPEVPQARVICAWLRCGRDRSIVSHQSALAALGVAPEAAEVHVTIAVGAEAPGGLPPHVVIHRGELGTRTGAGPLIVSTAARALDECAAAGESQEYLEAARAAAVKKKLLRLPKERDAVPEVPAPGAKGAPQPVFDLLFGESNTALVPHPRGVASDGATRLSRADATPAGWCGGRAPAIDVDAWPRSPQTGFPMAHLLTLALPPEYRRKGAELVGIALFQADDHVAVPTPGANETLTSGVAAGEGAFFAALARAHARRHPEAVDLTDLIGGHFVLVWLREGELRGPRTAPPPDDRASAPAVATGQNLNAWDHAEPEVSIWLAPRAFDPNAGKAPVEVWSDDEDEGSESPSADPEGYVDVVLSKVEKLRAFFDEHHGRSHLGGTCLPVQAMPEGLTPWFLELEDEVGGANFGGGNMQLDLESGVFDWAC
jgi:hypothetical protein